MALTPEDVVNKRFQSTKFREGYDQDEVDDFLDEVVIELRRLEQENEELRQRVSAADARVAELERTGGASGAEAAAPAVAAVAAPEPAAAAAPSSDLDDPDATNNLLQLARRLHEEHVRDGVAKRDALVAEGESRAAQLVSDAEARASQTVSEAESRAAKAISDADARASQTVSDAESRAAQLVSDAESRSSQRVSEAETRIAELEGQRSTLEQKVDELRSFEAEYRTSLKGFIEGQLRDLEGAAGEAAPVEAPAGGSEESQDEAADESQDAPAEADPFPGFASEDSAATGEQPTGWGRPQGFGGN